MGNRSISFLELDGMRKLIGNKNILLALGDGKKEYMIQKKNQSQI